MTKFDKLINRTKNLLTEAISSNKLKDLIKQITLGKKRTSTI